MIDKKERGSKIERSQGELTLNRYGSLNDPYDP